MVRRRLQFVAWTLGVSALGCSSEPTTIVSPGLATSAVSFDPGPAAIEFQLTSFDVATRTLTGVSRLADVCDNLTPVDPCRFRLNAALTSDSWTQPANTDRFTPVDPCKAIAVNYNTVVVDVSVDLAINALATQGCNARVLVDQLTGTIRQFQPVP